VIRMKVNQLAANAADLPINTLWTVLWNNPVTGDAFPRKFVQMNTCDPLTRPAFSYGHVEGTIQRSDGDLTSGCSFSPDGTIEIQIPRSLVGNAPVNGILGGITAETRLLIGAACSGSIQSIDNAVGTAYVVRGNGYCAPHAVSCAGDLTQAPGDYRLDFDVQNPSTAARAFQVQISDASGWLVGGPVAATLGPVSPGSSARLSVVARLPQGCSGSPSLFTWTATAADLPSAVATQSCNTSVACHVATGVGDAPKGALALAVVGTNPFRESTLLSFQLPRAERVKVEVFSVTGHKVRTLLDASRDAGTHLVPFALRGADGRGLGPGVYLVRLTAGAEVRTLRAIGLR